MLTTKRATCLLISVIVLLFHSCGNRSDSPVIGPEKGSLVIAGGGRIPTVIHEKFASLAGGFEANIVVIPTAGSPDRIDTLLAKEKWEDIGFSNVTVLHTTDPEEANKKEFYSKIDSASGVWFEGGRQWRLVDAYYKTQTHISLYELLKRGGVIGGSSAGASIQGSFLARGDVSGNTIMISDNEKHRKGLGFLKNTAIDQHIDTRNRWGDIQEIVLKYPRLLGIGISESTAIIVSGDTFEVKGAGNVAITTHESITGEDNGIGYKILYPGDNYNMRDREKIKLCDIETVAAKKNN